MRSSLKRALLIFLRYPEPGKVKTRLAASIGDVEAAGVYGKLVLRTLSIARKLKQSSPDVCIFICFDPLGREREIRQSYPGPWEFIHQSGNDLGTRMENAFHYAMHNSFGNVVLIGTDISDLAVEDLDEAFQALNQGASVLGPAADGGFYLIGLSVPCSQAFKQAKWGTSDVFRRTQSLLTNSGLSVKKLKKRRDVDRAEDLVYMDIHSDFEHMGPAGDSISVIIPTLRDPLSFESLITIVEKDLRPDDEIVVVYGGHLSIGNNCPLGRRARLIHSPIGRGNQLNAGAAAAKKDLFFFLHDDSLPPPYFASSVRFLAKEPQVSLGCFELAFSPSTKLLELIARWANLRSRILGLPYGDQGLFCRRVIFEMVGGFRNEYLMEDVELVRGCRRLGKLMIAPLPIYTSSREYINNGILRTSLKHHFTMLMYQLGVDERRLFSFYYKR